MPLLVHFRDLLVEVREHALLRLDLRVVDLPRGDLVGLGASVYIYIYIYRERERDDTDNNKMKKKTTNKNNNNCLQRVLHVLEFGQEALEGRDDVAGLEGVPGTLQYVYIYIYREREI